MLCRLCNSSTTEILNFGETALANSFLDYPTQKEVFSPLIVHLCQDCGSVQLKDVVNPEILFSSYLYESSTSASFRKHFEDYAKTVFEKYLQKDDLVIDIGSNDGILLHPFQKLGCKVLGIEPAKNIKSSVPTINAFFSHAFAKTLNKKAKVITANNVFAHISDLHDIIEGVKELLAPDGAFLFENAYLLDTINNLYFDQVYAEHLYYHSLNPLQKLFKAHNMGIVDVSRNNIQGGSIRVTTKIGDYPDIDTSHEDFLYDPITYVNFTNKLVSLKQDLHKTLQKYKRVCAYGAPAKLTTFCKVMDITNLEFVIDDAKAKQGKFTPGTHFPVVSSNYLPNSDACLVTAWNFAKNIIASREYKGVWIIPLPEVTECKCVDMSPIGTSQH